MFNACEFMYGGESSITHGLMIYAIGGNGQNDVPYGNVAHIFETRVPLRVTPIHYGFAYHQQPLRFKLVFGSIDPLGRFDVEEVGYWLTGRKEYDWLHICDSDLDHVDFRCIFETITPIAFGGLHYAFEAQVVCDCSYAYGLPFKHTMGAGDYTITNTGSVRQPYKPTVVVENASGDFSITNHSTGKVMKFTGLPAIQRIEIDCENEVISTYPSEIDLYNGYNFSFDFLELERGDNELTIATNGTVTIQGRYYHNTAG